MEPRSRATSTWTRRDADHGNEQGFFRCFQRQHGDRSLYPDQREAERGRGSDGAWTSGGRAELDQDPDRRALGRDQGARNGEKRDRQRRGGGEYPSYRERGADQGRANGGGYRLAARDSGGRRKLPRPDRDGRGSGARGVGARQPRPGATFGSPGRTPAAASSAGPHRSAFQNQHQGLPPP